VVVHQQQEIVQTQQVILAVQVAQVVAAQVAMFDLL
jgi:hypothetical protein